MLGALQDGFRACKICNPLHNAFELPQQVEKALGLFLDNPKNKIQDWQLKEAGLTPDKIRKWFQENFGLSYHAFQRMTRLNNAYLEAKQRKLNAVADTNFGFKYLVKKSLNWSDDKIYLTRLPSPIGPMFAAATSQGICLLEFTDRRMLETEFKDLQVRLKATIIVGKNKHLKKLATELNGYFEGQSTSFTVPLHTPGSNFHKACWHKLQQINYATTTTYEALANQNGTTVQKIANANGNNRIAIIIPCHRTLGKDGSLQGYGGGLSRKKWLLDHEYQLAKTKKSTL